LQSSMVLKDFSYCYSLVTTNVFMAYWLDEFTPFLEAQSTAGCKH
jgi:hypothetical protein